MEVVSGTAAILQLLAAAITVTEATLALLRAISDAPREVQEIAIKVSIIQSQLQQLDIIKNSIGRSEDRTLSPEFKRTIELSLAKTRVAKVELQNAIRPLQGRRGLAEAPNRGAELESESSHPGNISLNLNTAVLEVQQGVDDLLTNVDNVRENLGVTPLGKTSRSLEHSTHYYLRPSLWNGRAECHMYTGGRKPRSTCTIDIPLPLPFRGSRVLRFKFVTLSVKRLVPDDSNIIRSCRGGFLVGVQKLLRHGTASVNDATSLGLTPLMCTIDSGNLDLVQFLIAAGADVNAQLDHCSTQVP
ncbi:hypothetical protein BJX68DRAFT_267594 [Aspergillus pseudodeflectus]|uniref:Ankyrin repeat-containing domain protein n=1 Tax=Aspergillus pseudodeflectus TaxID=176178 RepID=A0ABR4K8W7_9EURO